MPVAPIDPAHADGEVAARLDEMRRMYGGVPLTARYLAHSATALEAFFGMAGAASRVLTPRMREQLALFSAEYNDCSLCRAMHGRNAARVGLTAEEIEAGRRGEAADPREGAALQLAAAILDGRGHVPEDVMEQARRTGFEDEDLLEVFVAVASNLMTNFFNRFADLSAEDLPVPTGAAA